MMSNLKLIRTRLKTKSKFKKKELILDQLLKTQLDFIQSNNH